MEHADDAVENQAVAVTLEKEKVRSGKAGGAEGGGVGSLAGAKHLMALWSLGVSKGIEKT